MVHFLKMFWVANSVEVNRQHVLMSDKDSVTRFEENWKVLAKI